MGYRVFCEKQKKSNFVILLPVPLKREEKRRIKKNEG